MPAYSMVGHALMNCASLQDALAVLLRYQRLISEAGTLSTESRNGEVVVAYRPQPGVNLLPQQTEAIFAGLFQQANWLAPSSLVARAVCFAHDRVAPLDAYVDAFGREPSFGASIAFGKEDLVVSLPLADNALHAEYCGLAERVFEPLPPVGFVSGFARQWLRARPLDAVTPGMLANALGASTRHVQRQLKEENGSWQSLLDDARRERALDLLKRHCALAQIAEALGYHDASSASRALRRWCGSPPDA